MHNRKIFAAAIAIALLHPGCGMKKMATKVIGDVSTGGIIAVESESDVAFARESLPALIKTLEVLRHGNPKDAKANALLSRAYGTFTFGFVEEDLLSSPEGDPRHQASLARAKEFYRRGREYGIASLAATGGMKAAFKSPFPEFKKAISSLGKKHVPALFWTSFNWANWININRDDPMAVVDLPRIQAMVDRVIELDPDYYYGSAHTIRALLAASRPEMLGGDLDLADREIEAAIKASPDYLMTKVMCAQYVARQKNDRALFKGMLGDVGSADAAALPEQMLANELAKRRAKILLSLENRLF
jgi:hypothetical protein